MISRAKTRRVRGIRRYRVRPHSKYFSPHFTLLIDLHETTLFPLFSTDTRKLGLCIIVNAQKTNWRTTRVVLHLVSEIFRTELTNIIVLRPEAFWDKQKVEHCAKIKQNGGVS